MKDIFVKEATCTGITTLEHELSLPVAVEYIPGKVDKIQTQGSIEHTIRQLLV